MSKLSLKQAALLLQEARNDYYNAWYFGQKAKGDRKKQLQREMDAINIRVQNIINSCPEVLDYTDEFSFSPNYFRSDLDVLVENLSKIKFEE